MKNLRNSDWGYHEKFIRRLYLQEKPRRSNHHIPRYRQLNVYEGLIERSKRTLKDVLKKVLDEDGKDWDFLLPAKIRTLNPGDSLFGANFREYISDKCPYEREDHTNYQLTCSG